MLRNKKVQKKPCDCRALIYSYKKAFTIEDLPQLMIFLRHYPYIEQNFQ